MKIRSEKVLDSSSQKLLGIHITAKFSFDDDVKILCHKASHKLNALLTVALFMNLNQRKIQLKPSTFSKFGYRLLVCMCHSRRLNNCTNNIHERALRIVFRDHITSLEQLLKKDKSVKIH